jgi:hypothetical protein
MAAPQTNGILRTTLESMNIGDYIKCEIAKLGSGPIVFTSSFLGNLSTDNNELSPTTPHIYAVGSSITRTFFYLIKVDTGLLIADRIILANISAQALNGMDLFLGKKLSDKCMLRCLSRAEFLKYISNSDLNGNIAKADVNVWHGQTGATAIGVGNHYIELNQDRVSSNIKTSFLLSGVTLDSTAHATTGSASRTIYILNGYTSTLAATYTYGGMPYYDYLSFRPALEYIDNSKSTNLYY